MARKKAAKAKSSAKKKLSDERKAVAAVSYLFGIISGIIIYLWKEKDDYARFHASQSILFCIMWTVIAIVLAIITAPLLIVPVIGWALMGLVWTIYWIIGIVSWLYLMYEALKGNKYEYPVIAEYAKRW